MHSASYIKFINLDEVRGETRILTEPYSSTVKGKFAVSTKKFAKFMDFNK